MKRLTAVAALLMIPALAGCNTTEVKSSSPSNSSSSSSSSADAGSTAAAAPDTSTESSSDASSEPTSEASDGSSMTKPFGSTFTWDDKLAVTVSKPVPFTPSEYAATGSKFKKFVAMDVTITNGTGKVYDSSSFTADATSGDQESEKVFDSGKGIDYPSSKILPGKSLKFKMAFGHTPGQDFTLVVNSYDDFNRADGIYSGKP